MQLLSSSACILHGPTNKIGIEEIKMWLQKIQNSNNMNNKQQKYN